MPSGWSGTPNTTTLRCGSTALSAASRIDTPAGRTATPCALSSTKRPPSSKRATSPLKMGAAQASSPTRAPTSRNTPKMEIPAAYEATLSHVRDVFHGALIAGGCLRDREHDRQVKPTNIFAPTPGGALQEARRLVG